MYTPFPFGFMGCQKPFHESSPIYTKFFPIIQQHLFRLLIGELNATSLGVQVVVPAMDMLAGATNNEGPTYLSMAHDMRLYAMTNGGRT